MPHLRKGIEAEVRAGDTEPLTIKVSANGLLNLDEFATGKFYARKLGDPTNHVNGAAITVLSSTDKTVNFDPAGNGPGGANAFAIGQEGSYDCYVLIAFTDGDEVRFPGKQEMLRLTVTNTWE